MMALGRGAIAPSDPGPLETFFWKNRYFDPSSLFALRSGETGHLLGVGLAIINPEFAEPIKLDPAMPCFRLGAFGTEQERHKRVNGMFSGLFPSSSAGEVLLGEAKRRLESSGVRHVAAQAASDQVDVVAFLDRRLKRQGSFPIYSRVLA
jgi:hypothetical protein